MFHKLYNCIKNKILNLNLNILDLKFDVKLII
jgi:hypothetical protein